MHAGSEMSLSASVYCSKYPYLYVYLYSDLNLKWVWPKPEGFFFLIKYETLHNLPGNTGKHWNHNPGAII